MTVVVSGRSEASVGHPDLARPLPRQGIQFPPFVEEVRLLHNDGHQKIDRYW